MGNDAKQAALLAAMIHPIAFFGVLDLVCDIRCL